MTGFMVKNLNILDIYRLIKFFIRIDKDRDIRRHYRLFTFSSITESIKTLLYLFVYLSPLYYLLLKRKFYAHGLLMESTLVGISHIDLNLKNGIGEFGIVLSREVHGKGLGKKMMKLALLHAFGNNALIIFLSVDRDNVKAVNLYKSMGFKIVHPEKIDDYIAYMYIDKRSFIRKFRYRK